MVSFVIAPATSLSDEEYSQYEELIRIFDPERCVRRELVVHLLTNPDYTVFFARTESGEVVGTVRIMRKLQNDAIECEVDDMIVHPTHRGIGIGRALMNEAHRLGIDRYKPDRFVLTSNPSRIEARSLYVSLGYRAVSETTWFEKPHKVE